jgi:hypothetical protein
MVLDNDYDTFVKKSDNSIVYNLARTHIEIYEGNEVIALKRPLKFTRYLLNGEVAEGAYSIGLTHNNVNSTKVTLDISINDTNIDGGYVQIDYFPTEEEEEAKTPLVSKIFNFKIIEGNTDYEIMASP